MEVLSRSSQTLPELPRSLQDSLFVDMFYSWEVDLSVSY